MHLFFLYSVLQLVSPWLSDDSDLCQERYEVIREKKASKKVSICCGCLMIPLMLSWFPIKCSKKRGKIEINQVLGIWNFVSKEYFNQL